MAECFLSAGKRVTRCCDPSRDHDDAVVKSHFRCAECAGGLRVRMSKARLVITAVTVEGLSQGRQSAGTGGSAGAGSAGCWPVTAPSERVALGLMKSGVVVTI
jgi:hypothetical protein